LQKRVDEDVNLINFCKEDGSHGHRRKSQQKNTKKIITYIKWWETHKHAHVQMANNNNIKLIGNGFQCLIGKELHILIRIRFDHFCQCVAKRI